MMGPNNKKMVVQLCLALESLDTQPCGGKSFVLGITRSTPYVGAALRSPNITILSSEFLASQK